MPCLPHELKNIPLFSLLDDDELAILAGQVEVRKFAARQRIYKMGDIGKNAFVVTSGTVQGDGERCGVWLECDSWPGRDTAHVHRAAFPGKGGS